MNDLESGLFLPIRFYYQQTEQDRYKPQSYGVALTELNYPYVDCVSLAPFQLNTVSATLSDSVLFYAVCADSEELISLVYDSAHWQEYIDSEGIYHLSYLGDDNFTGELSNGLYYFIVAIVWPGGGATANFYSDFVMINNCTDAAYDITEFRTYSEKVAQSNDLLRSINTTDLRITK